MPDGRMRRGYSDGIDLEYSRQGIDFIDPGRTTVVATDATPERRPLRSDARANRNLILAAGRKLLASRGKQFTVAEVADAAGVGRATVYRNFENIDALITAIGVEQVEHVQHIARRVLDTTGNPEFELPFLMFALYEFNRSNPLYLELFRRDPAPELLAAQRRNRETLGVIIGRAKAIALIYDDVEAEDLYTLIGGSAMQLSSAPVVSGQQWRRLARLVLYGAGVPREVVGRAEQSYAQHPMSGPDPA